VPDVTGVKNREFAGLYRINRLEGIWYLGIKIIEIILFSARFVVPLVLAGKP
jgi:hypothetical protein